MPIVEFQAVLPRSSSRKRKTRPGIGWAGACVIGALFIYEASWRPISTVHSIPVTASRVLVLVDRSGSMPDFATVVQPVLDRLAAAGISIDATVDTQGFAISAASNDYWNMLPQFETAVAGSPGADAVFIVTDFSNGDEESNDAEGYQRFRAILSQRNMRAYWFSVRDPAPPAYRHIADASKGAIIPPQ